MDLLYTSLILTTKQKLIPSQQQCFYSPFSAHCASPGLKPKLLNYLRCNMSERSEAGQENILCDKDIQYFFSPMANHTFRKAQGVDRFLISELRELKATEILQQCNWHKRDPSKHRAQQSSPVPLSL